MTVQQQIFTPLLKSAETDEPYLNDYYVNCFKFLDT